MATLPLTTYAPLVVSGGDDKTDETHPKHDKDSTEYVDPSRWCICRKDLDVFEEEVRAKWSRNEIPRCAHQADHAHDDKNIGPSVYQVVTHYVIPATPRNPPLSWALMMNPDGLECDLFATHAWIEGVFEFISAMGKAWPWQASNAYVCFLSNPQPLPSGFLGNDPHTSPFFSALEIASFMVIIPNRNESIYKRLWCVFEASEAIKLTKDNDLKMSLPWVADKWDVMEKVVPAMPLPVIGFLIGYFLLARSIGVLLGPVMWLVLTWCFCNFTLRLLRIGMATWTMADASRWNRAMQILIIFECMELFFMGVAFGLSWSHFVLEEELYGSWMSKNIKKKLAYFDLSDLGVQWEKGEGTSCPQILIAFCLGTLYKITLVLTRDVVKKMGGRLADFDSVASAKCSSDADAREIHEVVDPRQQIVDRDIWRLIEIGRFNKAVKRNLDLGMSVETVADGINPFKIACAVYCWEFWWITDVAGRGHRIFAVCFPITTVLCLWVLVYRLGDITIFAIDAFLYCGVLCVLTSNHKLFFNEEAVTSLTMSGSCARLQIVWVVIMLLLNAYHYCGWRMELREKMNEAGCEGCADTWLSLPHPVSLQKYAELTESEYETSDSENEFSRISPRELSGNLS